MQALQKVEQRSDPIVINPKASAVFLIAVNGKKIEQAAYGQASAEELEFVASYLITLASKLRRAIN